MDKDVVVYKDERYILEKKDGLPTLTANGKKYQLTCHPYEPCLYITDESGFKTAVHNSFDPLSVLYVLRSGSTLTSITGFEYDALDFCRMVEYAANMVDIQIDEAEKVFGGRTKKKNPEPEKSKETKEKSKNYRMGEEAWIEDDPFFDVLNDYPDCVIDYCLLKNEWEEHGYNWHWFALVFACCKLFLDDDESVIWQYDAGKAKGKQISVNELFAHADRNGKLNYRTAFLYPPYENNYKNTDFEKINAALFPNGTDGLEVFEWTTDWSEYFDEGHEWWGTLCLTVYDKTLDRFAVIMASATD